MRREWAGWIRDRNWAEVERLAKADPSQQLADTVAELVIGLEEKDDVRRLKRILFLLERSGVTPSRSEIEEMQPIGTQKASSGQSALIFSADGRGDAVLMWGVPSDRGMRWLTAIANHGTGVVRAYETETVGSDPDAMIKSAGRLYGSTMVGAPAPTEYVAWRIAQAVQRTSAHALPPCIAYWRRLIDAAQPARHPADDWPVAEVDAETLQLVPIELPGARLWRLELGLAAPVLQQVMAVDAEESLGEEERKARLASIYDAARGDLITSDVIDDHSLRLMDLSFVLSHTQPEQSRIALACARDLRARGAESEYARAILGKTLLLFVESIRRAQERAAGSR